MKNTNVVPLGLLKLFTDHRLILVAFPTQSFPSVALEHLGLKNKQSDSMFTQNLRLALVVQASLLSAIAPAARES